MSNSETESLDHYAPFMSWKRKEPFCRFLVSYFRRGYDVLPVVLDRRISAADSHSMQDPTSRVFYDRNMCRIVASYLWVNLYQTNVQWSNLRSKPPHTTHRASYRHIAFKFIKRCTPLRFKYIKRKSTLVAEATKSEQESSLAFCRGGRRRTRRNRMRGSIRRECLLPPHLFCPPTPASGPACQPRHRRCGGTEPRPVACCCAVMFACIQAMHMRCLLYSSSVCVILKGSPPASSVNPCSPMALPLQQTTWCA